MASKTAKNSLARTIAIFIAVYFVLAGVFYWIVSADWRAQDIETSPVNASSALDRAPEGLNIEQTFLCEMDSLRQIELFPATYGVVNQGDILLQICDQDTVLWENTFEMADAFDTAFQAYPVEPSVEGMKGKELSLHITTIPEAEGGVSFFYGNTISAGKFDVEISQNGVLMQGGTPVEGQLVMRTSGQNYLHVMGWYWPVCIAMFAVCMAVYAYYIYCVRKGRRGLMVIAFELMKNYQYLLKQLVVRDFKLKYKASMLGVLWSFLNPLLSMLVYYFVFSTIFQNDIREFPVYLLCGITFLNYFVESTTLGLTSIVNNASLITKVYMPKFIYPISRTVSSAINMIIAIIPLLIAMLVTGVPYTRAMLLIPVVMLFLIIFCAGVSMLLSCMMVFFRDTQFLWSVVSMLINFLTPVFYPESIIPAQYIHVYRMNPLYQFITFLRCIVLEGTAPEPMAFLRCVAASVPVLLIGLYIFRKKQDRFVFYL